MIEMRMATLLRCREPNSPELEQPTPEIHCPLMGEGLNYWKRSCQIRQHATPCPKCERRTFEKPDRTADYKQRTIGVCICGCGLLGELVSGGREKRCYNRERQKQLKAQARAERLRAQLAEVERSLTSDINKRVDLSMDESVL